MMGKRVEMRLILSGLVVCFLLIGCGCTLKNLSLLKQETSERISDQSAQESSQGESRSASGVPDAKTKETEEEKADEKGTVLFFASDYQHRDGWMDPPDTLDGVLNSIYDAGLHLDNAFFCGDYTTEHGHNNYNADPDLAIQEIKSIFLAHDEDLDENDMIFEQGNHDKMTDAISTSGLHEYDNYLVYVLNTESEFPWRQGRKHLKQEVEQGAWRLRNCMEKLKEQGEMRPVFLLGHVPLHFSGRTSFLQGTGDNLYSAPMFRVINEAAEDLNLVYFYGHNHSRGWDSYLGGSCVFREPGDWILVPRPEEDAVVTSSYSKETINFTYLNAGYLGYFSSAGGEETLTGTVCEVRNDSLVFSRYSVDGIYLLSAEGAPNPAKDDREMIPEEYYGTELKSNHSVRLH